MAEMEAAKDDRCNNRSRIKKNKKLSARVDLTPMVDLGFLLITFFTFTTTMSQSTALPLNLPKDVDKPEDLTKVKRSAVLTIIPGKNDQLYYYEGVDCLKIQRTTFKGIRDVILDKKRLTDGGDFFVILKPDQDASYGNVVNIVDEMKIDGVTRFAEVDISPFEYTLVQKIELTKFH